MINSSLINFNSQKFLYPTHPLRSITTGPSNVGKSVIFKSLILNIIFEYYKIYIYSPSFHQDIYQKLNEYFSNFIPIHIIPNILSDEDIDVVIDEKINNKDFQNYDIEIETIDSIKEIKFPQEYENISIIILDNLNEKQINNDKIRAIFKRRRHTNLSIFIIRQDYYELPKSTIKATGSIYHMFKPNIFRVVQNLYQVKAGMDMTLNEFEFLTSICLNEKYHPLTIDMNKDK